MPVLLSTVMELLSPEPGEMAVDCTVGHGGHTQALLDAVGPTGRVIGFDLDAEALAFASAHLRGRERFEPVHASFVRAPAILIERGEQADVVLADLGFSSAQMDDPERGFSFSAEGPLDMRLDREGSAVTAAQVVAAASVTELADIIYRYGEEPLSRKIARHLVEARRREPIRTTTRLAELVVEAYGGRARHSRMHPATRTFMALRIVVNDELTALQALLDRLGDGWLRPGARVGIISFHSLEDRMVKRAFAALAADGAAERLTKKPITADEAEIAANPRSRSAKLRVIRMH